MTGRSVRLAVVTSHPVQYYSPLFRELARRVDLTVLYGHRATPADQARAGFGVAFEWDVDLTSGFTSRYLTNRARSPGLAGFFGIDTPDICEHLKEGNYDAVLLIGWHKKFLLQALIAARRLGIPALMRGDSQLVTPRSRLARIAKELAYPVFLKQYAAALTVGVRNREYWLHYRYPPNRIFASPHCIDTEWFADRASPAARQALRTKLAIAETTPLILFAGKLVKFKRPLSVVEAVAELRRNGTQAEVLVAGDGPLRQELERCAAAQHVPMHLLSFCNQSEMPAVYAAADVLALPSSEFETWGLVANEALACGTPVIVADSVGCSPDLVRLLGDEVRFPSGQVKALAARLDAALRSPPSRASIERTSRALSLAAAADGIVEALASVSWRQTAVDLYDAIRS